MALGDLPKMPARPFTPSRLEEMGQHATEDLGFMTRAINSRKTSWAVPEQPRSFLMTS